MNACGRGAHRVKVRPLALVLSAIAISLSLPTVAGAQLMPAQGARAAARFWTAARMQQAKPLNVQGSSGGQIELDGPTTPVAETPHVLPRLTPRAGSASASSAFEAVPDPVALENRVNGVIFIVTPFGLGRCSGTSVNAPNYSVVFTAAHCIHTGGRFGRWMDFNWVFVPGYRYGQRPFGVFPAKWIDTTPQWRTSGSENFDIGAAVVGRNERGQLLAKAVGGTGIAWD